MPIYKDEVAQQLNLVVDSTRRKLGDHPVNLKSHAWGYSMQERQHHLNVNALYDRLNRLGFTTRREPNGSYFISPDAFVMEQEIS